LQLLEREDHGAREPREARDRADAHRDHHIDEAGAEGGHHRDGQENAREGQQHIHGPHHRRVEAGEGARGETPQDAPPPPPRPRSDGGGDPSHEQRQPRAEEDAREDAAAELVRTQRKLERRPRQGVGQVLPDRIVGRQLTRGEGEGAEEQDERETAHGESMTEEAARRLTHTGFADRASRRGDPRPGSPARRPRPRGARTLAPRDSRVGGWPSWRAGPPPATRRWSPSPRRPRGGSRTGGRPPSPRE